MAGNCEPLGKLIRIPVLTDPDPLETERKLKYAGMLLKKAEEEEAEKAKAVLEDVARKARREAKKKKAAAKKKYQPRIVPEFKSLPEIYPQLFEELIERNRSDYMSLINEKLNPHIARKLEKEVNRFVYARTLAFNKTVEKIKYGEFINGTISNSGTLITEGIGYSLTSIYEGIKLATKRKTFFTYQFKEGDYYWFFLNTSENQVLLEQIEAGHITEKQLFKMNELKVKSLRKKRKEKENLNDPPSENVADPIKNSGRAIQKMNGTYSDGEHKTIENTGVSEPHITTINNNYIEKQQQKNNGAGGSSFIRFSEREEEYIQKLLKVKTPEGENIRFSLPQAREIVKLDLGRPIFDIIDEKIEMLFLEKNTKNSSWAGILNNMIKQDRGGPEAYLEFKKTREDRQVYDKYLSLIRIFEPDARTETLDRDRAIKFIQDKIITLYEVAVRNKNLEVRDELLTKLSELKKSCDLEKDLGFHIKNPDSALYQMVQELKNLD